MSTHVFAIKNCLEHRETLQLTSSRFFFTVNIIFKNERFIPAYEVSKTPQELRRGTEDFWILVQLFQSSHQSNLPEKSKNSKGNKHMK